MSCDECAFTKLLNSFPGKTVNFEKVAFANVVFLDLLGFALFLVQIQMLQILRLNKTIGILYHTLKSSGQELGHFAVLLAIILFSFDVLCLGLFGSLMEQFRDFKMALVTLVSTMLGRFNFSSWVLAGGLAAKIVFMIYMTLMVYFVVNTFLFILDHSYHSTQEAKELIGMEDEKLLTYMYRCFLSFIGWRHSAPIDDNIPGKVDTSRGIYIYVYLSPALL